MELLDLEQDTEVAVFEAAGVIRRVVGVDQLASGLLPRKLLVGLVR